MASRKLLFDKNAVTAYVEHSFLMEEQLKTKKFLVEVPADFTPYEPEDVPWFRKETKAEDLVRWIKDGLGTKNSHDSLSFIKVFTIDDKNKPRS